MKHAVATALALFVGLSVSLTVKLPHLEKIEVQLKVDKAKTPV